MRAYLLVGIQFTLIALLAWYGGVWGTAFGNAFIVAGIVVGLLAVVTMRFRFSIWPDVRTGQALYTSGPYAFVRHPMYTAVLLTAFGLVLNRPDAVSAVMWLALALDLRIKLGYEERALTARFPEYVEYMQRTKRLIPGVY